MGAPQGIDSPCEITTLPPGTVAGKLVGDEISSWHGTESVPMSIPLRTETEKNFFSPKPQLT